jgi:hypothetical protein
VYKRFRVSLTLTDDRRSGSQADKKTSPRYIAPRTGLLQLHLSFLSLGPPAFRVIDVRAEMEMASPLSIGAVCLIDIVVWQSSIPIRNGTSWWNCATSIVTARRRFYPPIRHQAIGYGFCCGGQVRFRECGPGHVKGDFMECMECCDAAILCSI